MAIEHATGNPGNEDAFRLIAPNRFAVGRRQVALGLLWQPVKPGLALRDQARLADGSTEGFDLYAQQSDARQIGFGTTRDRLSPRMLVGATAIDSSKWGDNWLAALKLPGDGDLWWIVAMRNSQIYEDRLHKSEATARRALEVSLEAPDWEKIIAPDPWNIARAEHSDLSDVLSLRNAVPLKRVNWELRAFAVAAGVSLLAAVLIFTWTEWSERRSEVDDAPKTLAAKLPETKFPWEVSPWIPDFISGCLGRMDRLMILPPGWLVDSLVCVWSGKSASARVVWRHDGGSPAFLRAAASGIGGVDISIGANGGKAELSLPVPLLHSAAPLLGEPMRLPLLEKVVRERFRSLGLEAAVSRRNSAANQASDTRLRHLDLTVSSSAGMDEFGMLMSDLPGLVPEALVYRPAANVWQLTMRAYSKPLEEQLNP